MCFLYFNILIILFIVNFNFFVIILNGVCFSVACWIGSYFGCFFVFDGVFVCCSFILCVCMILSFSVFLMIFLKLFSVMFGCDVFVMCFFVNDFKLFIIFFIVNVIICVLCVELSVFC